MSTIPPSIAGLSQILKNEGHITSLFDTTFYKFDDEITIEDSDAITSKALTNRPVLDIDDDDLHFKKTTKSAVDDFRKLIGSTNPENAEEGTIRKLYATSVQANAIHGSDSDENAEIEIKFFFS